jgi:hypothetical protein
MTSVLEILKLEDLYLRKEHLINQINKVNNEIERRLKYNIENNSTKMSSLFNVNYHNKVEIIDKKIKSDNNCNTEEIKTDNNCNIEEIEIDNNIKEFSIQKINEKTIRIKIKKK